ncbi:MAG: 2OG-Fe(II) oxygenase [Marinicaulis sp.]|nr:2OG-Fe(II) oxygenase [Marinicaulis sp.]NNL87760.1 2OG-Fe(II) oxygenase [Marinicaulis sp.]
MSGFDDNGLIAGAPIAPESWHNVVKGVPPGRIISNYTAPPGIFVIQNFCEPGWCDQLVRECEGQAGARHRVGAGGGGDLDASVNDRRTSDAIDSHDLQTDIVSAIRMLFTGPISQHFQVQIDWFERPEILRYRDGGEYKAHADSQIFDPNEKKYNRVIDRDLSILVYLNGDFDGGELYFPSFDFGLKPQRGMVAAFPSDGRFVHLARPVTNGTKYTIVSWAAAKGGPRVMAGPPNTAMMV